MRFRVFVVYYDDPGDLLPDDPSFFFRVRWEGAYGGGGDHEAKLTDPNLGRHHVGQCGTCPLRPKCVEGFWALRVDHDGGLQACLLREDLRQHLKPFLDDPARLAKCVAGHITAFTEGTL